MSNYLSRAKTAVNGFCTDLSALKSKILGINSSVCDSIVSKISTASQTQEQQIAGLEAIQKKANEFIDLTVNRDNSAASEVSKRKDDFYKQYSYLKPECEKSDWEKFCDGLKKVGEWCKEHWKLIATAIMVVVAIAIIICTGGTALGPVMAVVLAAAKGLLIGAAVGGLCGGIFEVIKDGNFGFATFLEGFEAGAGAISGAVAGGMSAGISGWTSGGGQAALRSLSTGKKVLIGGIGDTVASVFGDLGDVVIQDKDMSIGEFAVNTVFSFALGFVATDASNKISQKIELKIPGINSGQGSWAHIGGTQSTSSIRHQSIINLKSILKGLGADFVSGAWDYVFETPKNIFSELKIQHWSIKGGM